MPGVRPPPAPAWRPHPRSGPRPRARRRCGAPPARPRPCPRPGSRSRSRARASRPGCERLADRLLLLVRQRIARAPGLHGLGEDARLGAAVQARHDDAVPQRIEKRDGERLIAPRVRERVVSDDADLLDRVLRDLLQLVMELVQRIRALPERLDLLGLTVEDLIEARGF